MLTLKTENGQCSFWPPDHPVTAGDHCDRYASHATAPSEAWESEVTTLTPPPSSSGACWKGALTLWPEASSGAGWERRPSGPRRPTRCLCPFPLQLTQPNNCYHGILQRPLPAPFRPLLEASVLPPFRRLGRWPHLSRLPLHRPHGGPSLQLFHSSHGSGPGGYVVDTSPGLPIPGRAPSV